ncbi:MAG: hypothetical protein R3F43_25440, partial [bacterium]
MAKAGFHLVSAPGAGELRPFTATPSSLALAPGKWIARLARVGLADEIVAGSSDRLGAAIALGTDRKSEKSVAGRETTELAARLPAFEVAFEVAAGDHLPLGVALVMDRGKAPEIIEEFRTQVIAKAPAGTTPAIVTAALTAAFADLAVAVAVASFVAAADALLAKAFGKSPILGRSITLDGVEGGATHLTLCLTALPDRRSVNVGQVPGL